MTSNHYTLLTTRQNRLRRVKSAHMQVSAASTVALVLRCGGCYYCCCCYYYLYDYLLEYYLFCLLHVICFAYFIPYVDCDAVYESVLPFAFDYSVLLINFLKFNLRAFLCVCAFDDNLQKTKSLQMLLSLVIFIKCTGNNNIEHEREKSSKMFACYT